MTDLEAAFDAARDAYNTAFFDERDAHNEAVAADARAVAAREALRLAVVRLNDTRAAYHAAFYAFCEERDACDSE
jgi:hypothetical protein